MNRVKKKQKKPYKTWSRYCRIQMCPVSFFSQEKERRWWWWSEGAAARHIPVLLLHLAWVRLCYAAVHQVTSALMSLSFSVYILPSVISFSTVLHPIKLSQITNFQKYLHLLTYCSGYVPSVCQCVLNTDLLQFGLDWLLHTHSSTLYFTHCAHIPLPKITMWLLNRLLDQIRPTSFLH